tara:strand:- start:26 stop:442 length:417 start_codon:yes stop_codon:yes gene_type:complete
MTIKKNNLTSISKIKKEYPLFFDKVTMKNFNSIVYKDIKVLKDCTYFITSEILEYERIRENEIKYDEKNRVFKIRYVTVNCKVNCIRTCEHTFKTYHQALMYLDKLEHDNGGFMVSQHKANMALMRIKENKKLKEVIK